MSGWDYVVSLRFPFLRGPSSTKAKAAFSCAEALFFRTAPPLTKASFRRCGTARKKRPTFVERFCFGRDSVGIRTQDPQLRRLLLYPTELPNRSYFELNWRGISKTDCKGMQKKVNEQQKNEKSLSLLEKLLISLIVACLLTRYL